MYVCMYVHINLYIYIYVYIYLYPYIFIYPYIYIHFDICIHAYIERDIPGSTSIPSFGTRSVAQMRVSKEPAEYSGAAPWSRSTAACTRRRMSR